MRHEVRGRPGRRVRRGQLVQGVELGRGNGLGRDEVSAADS
jgi:hypothetical protein